jgi:hypothetical protein
MLEAHRPSAWYFRHFYINREFLIGETKFRCLVEMSECNASQDSRFDAAIQFSPEFASFSALSALCRGNVPF